MLRSMLFALALLGFGPLAAMGGEAGLLTRQTLESGQFEQGEKTIAARLDASPGDNEARFGLGMIRFAEAFQHFGQRQYRFGAHPTPRLTAPFLRVPIPANANPEEITYEKQRETLQAMLDDFAKVETTLAPMTADETAIVIDLDAVKFVFRAEGAPDQVETLGAIVAALLHAPADSAGATFEVKFDYADALWLRGYCQFLSASLEFFMAYNWRTTFERAGHLFYPRVAPPIFGVKPPTFTRSEGFFGDDAQIADAIVLVHELRWPLADGARLARVHDHLKNVIALSRASWKAILARTGDDREWIPGPQQKNGVNTGLPVAQEQVDAWFATLDQFDAVLDGRLLIPHWRFAEGINLKRALLEPRDFDLVLWAAGYSAVPYLESGPTLSLEDWRRWNESFHDNFLGYAFYFN